MTVSTALTARQKPLNGALVRIICGAPICPAWLGTAIHRDALDGDRPLTKTESDVLGAVQAGGGFTVAAFRDRLLEQGQEPADGDWIILHPTQTTGDLKTRRPSAWSNLTSTSPSARGSPYPVARSGGRDGRFPLP